MLQATYTEASKLSDTPGKKAALTHPYVSFVALAFILLLLCDLTARFTFVVWPIDKYNSPNRSWIWWAVKDFRQQKTAPDIVFLGSSLMMAALYGGDATYLNAPQEIISHHYSRYCQDLLLKSTGRSFHTFAFCIGGQMASDAYVIAAGMLKGQKKPGTIVYGIAPRDFMDDTMPSPASSETFHYLERVSDLKDVALSARQSFWDRIDYYLNQASFIYGHRQDFLYLQQNFVTLLLRRFGICQNDQIKTLLPLRKFAMLQLPEDFGPHDVFEDPYNPALKYPDNTQEYKARYAYFNHKFFADQLTYLQRLMAVCQARHIQLLLVNMPVTQGNMQLMPAGFYKAYIDAVESASRHNHNRFIDLNSPALFLPQYFADTVHLNGRGGMVFVRQLVLHMLN